jgi:hypothetical protein
MAKAKPRKRGSSRMRQLGQVSVTVWLDATEAADLDHVRGEKPRAGWVRDVALGAIERARKPARGR